MAKGQTLFDIETFWLIEDGIANFNNPRINEDGTWNTSWTASVLDNLEFRNYSNPYQQPSNMSALQQHSHPAPIINIQASAQPTQSYRDPLSMRGNNTLYGSEFFRAEPTIPKLDEDAPELTSLAKADFEANPDIAPAPTKPLPAPYATMQPYTTPSMANNTDSPASYLQHVPTTITPHMASTTENPTSRLQHVPLTVLSTQFTLSDQHFIIHGLTFYDYSPLDIAASFGLKPDNSGTPIKSVESILAVYDLLTQGRSNPINADMWTRDDEKHKANIAARIAVGRKELNVVRVARMKRE